MLFSLKLFIIFSFNKMDWFKVSCLCHPPWKRYTNPCWQVPLGWLGQKHWQSTVNRQISQQRLGRAAADRASAYFRLQLVFIIWMARMLRETSWRKPHQTPTVCEWAVTWGGEGHVLLCCWIPAYRYESHQSAETVHWFLCRKDFPLCSIQCRFLPKWKQQEAFCRWSVPLLCVTATHIPSQSFLATNLRTHRSRDPDFDPQYLTLLLWTPNSAIPSPFHVTCTIPDKSRPAIIHIIYYMI